MAGVLQHLRSSTLNKRPNPASMVDGQVAINYASGSPGMFFKDSNGSLVKVGPVHVGSDAPNVSPASGGTAGNSLGEQWLDTSGGTYVFKIWDGTAWRSESGEFVNTSGDTMTGSLTMGPSASVIFEGSTDDGFETTLTVIDPTADHTIRLPNVSGTIITSGDTGTVTSTMIANNTIVDADINSAAAIAGTKISPNFGGQNIVTSGTFIHALASSGAPSITFTGDTDTGVYSPGADQVAISTGGTERARIDSSGKLLVGTSTAETASLGARFQVQGTGSTASALIKRNDNGPLASYLYLGKSRGATVNSTTIVQNGDKLGEIRFAGADGSTEIGSIAASITAAVDGIPGDNDMPGRLVFSTTADGASSPTEQMRITNDGRVLIGHTSTASSATSSPLLTAGSSLIAGAGWESYVTNTATRYHAVFSINGTAVGSITTASTSTAYNTSSDYRLKENILPVTDGITRLQQLKPCRFNFIDSPNATVDGFLAHEVQTIVPEAITGEKDAVDDEGNPQYQGIDQSKLVPLLTSALQEAIGRIETLEAEVAALKAS